MKLKTKISIKNPTKNIFADPEFLPRTKSSSFLKNIWAISTVNENFLFKSQKEEGIRKTNAIETQFALRKGLNLTGSKIENKLFIVNF